MLTWHSQCSMRVQSGESKGAPKPPVSVEPSQSGLASSRPVCHPSDFLCRVTKKPVWLTVRNQTRCKTRALSSCQLYNCEQVSECLLCFNVVARPTPLPVHLTGGICANEQQVAPPTADAGNRSRSRLCRRVMCPLIPCVDARLTAMGA